MTITIYAHDSIEYITSTNSRHYEFAPQESSVHVGRSPYDGAPIGIDHSSGDSYVFGLLTGLPDGTTVAETKSGDLAVFLPGDGVGYSASDCATGALQYVDAAIHFEAAP
jgi:hypothetical protein